MFNNLALGCILFLTATSRGANSLKPTHNVDSSSANANSELCLQKATQMDKCLPKLVVYGDRNFDPPKTEQKLDEHCRMIDDNLKCIKDTIRQALQIKGWPPSADTLTCSSIDFINLMACADSHHMEPAHKCMDSFVAHLEHIGGGVQSRQIELTCCTFQLFQECIFSASKKMDCPHRVVTAEKSIEYVKTIINSMGGDVMDFMCGKYDKISNCVAGYPLIMSQFKEITEKILNGTMKARSNSPLRPMLQLFINNQDDL